MKNNETYNIDLLNRYFAGEASGEDILALIEWLKADAGNKQQFDDYNKVWQQLEKAKIESSIDIEEEWLKIHSRINSGVEEETKVKELYPDTKTNRKRFMRIVKIAAIIVWLALSTFLIIHYVNSSKEQVLTANTEMIQKILPDGTDITLGSGSTIVYPDKFKGDKRKIKLKGEAYFNIKHDAEQPFVVMVGDVRIEDIGTSFYVNTNIGNNNVEVVLTSGKVAVYYKDKPEEKTILEPGEKVVVSLTDTKITKSQNDDKNYIAWKTQKLIFADDPLEKVIPVLNKVYRSEIKLKTKSIAECRITATFDKQSLDAVLNVLKATLDLDIAKKGNTIEISGQGCK